VLEVCNASRITPEGRRLLYDVSLAVRAGERWAVTGPTGSGKTLLLRALAVLDPLEAGELLFNGKPVLNENVPTFRRQVIYLHQQPALIAGTVEDNLRLPFTFKSARRAGPVMAPVPMFNRERIVEYLSSLGRTEDFLNAESDNLSGGEGQIVAALRAIQLQPQVLLLDEPTAAMDQETTAAIESLVARWRDESDEQAAVVWVTHSAEQVARMADQVLRLEAGQVVE